MITITDAQELKEQLKAVQSELVPVSPNPVDVAWGSNRPQRSHDKVFIHPLEFAGQDYKEKLDKVRKYLFEKKQFGVIVSALDEVAWLFNLRGSDIDCSPVFYAYAVVTLTKVVLYIQPEKLTETVRQHLCDVQIRPYDAIFDDLKNMGLVGDQKMYVDQNTSMAIASAIGLVNSKTDSTKRKSCLTLSFC